MKLYFIKKAILSIVAIIILSFSSISLNATHIIGGDLTYRSIGNNDYEVTLSVRRDCFNGDDAAPFDDPAIIGIFDNNGNLKSNLGENGIIIIPISHNDTLNETVTSECGFIGQQVCVETTKYIDTVSLPFLAGGYTLAYQRCCRNGTINNIIDPIETGSAFFVEISEEALQLEDSSPTFNNWADIYLCKDQDLVFDQSATDLDGDSLVYSLCAPHTGLTLSNPVINYALELTHFAPPYDEIEWANPYSLDNLMGGTPLVIDPQTGIMTANPNLVGQFLVGVCVEEFRDGQFIGKTIRDFQYNVRVCSDPPVIDFSLLDYECGNLEVDFENTSTDANNFEWFFNNPSTSNDSTAMTVFGENVNFDYGVEGTYEVKLIGTRDSDGCSIETTKEITIYEEGVGTDFTTIVNSCNEDNKAILKLNDISVSDIDYTRYWIVSLGETTLNSTDDEWEIVLENDDDVIVELITTLGPCVDTLKKTVTSAMYRPQVSISFEIIECFDDSVSFKINPNYIMPVGVELSTDTMFVDTKYSGRYTFVESEEEIITLANIDTVTVDIVLISNNGCNYNYTETNIPEVVLIDLAVDNPHILCNGDSTRLINNPNSNWTYTWSTTDGLRFDSDTDLSNPWAKPQESITYGVTVTDGVCTEETTITINVLENSGVTIHGDRELCDTTAVKLWGEGIVIGSIELEWSTDADFETILYTGDTLTADLGNLQSQTYYTRIKGGTDCIATVYNTTITTHSSAEVSFTSELECGTYKVCFTSTTGLVDSLTSWDFGDTTTTDDIAKGNEVCYTYPSIGDYTVTLSDLSDFCNGEPISQIINVPNLIEFTIVGDTDLCDTEEVLLWAEGASIGIVDFEWSTDSDFSTIIYTGDTLSTTIDNGSSVTYYTRAKDCESNMQSTIVTTNYSPTINFTTEISCGTYEICFTSTSGLTDDLTSWNFGDLSTEGDIGTGNNICYTYPSPGEYVVTLSDLTDFCPGAPSIQTITVPAIVEFEIFGDANICDTEELILWAEGASIGVEDVEWSTNSNFSTIIHTGDTLKTTLNGVESQEYFARIDDGTGCPPIVHNYTVTTHIVPIMNFNSEVTCGTNEVCFTSTSGIADNLTSWDFGDLSTTTDVATGNNVCYTYPEPGNYDVTINDTNPICPGEATIHTITVPELVDITVENDQYEICNGESIVVNASTTNPDAEITYIDESGTEIGNGNTLDFTPSQNMIITAVATDSFGCTATHDVNVIVNNFEADLSLELTPDETGYAGQGYVLGVEGGLEGYAYLWSTGETTAQIDIAPIETTTYCVTVTDEHGCFEVLCRTITIDHPVTCSKDDIYLPTAFSPNSDDHNDVYLVRSNVLKSMELVIYDRWGEEIFISRDQAIGWDGTYKGASLSPDVYAYCIRAVCVNDKEYVKVGNVSLLK